MRNVARVSPPVVDRAPGERYDWEILLALARELGGGPTGIRWLDRIFTPARASAATGRPAPRWRSPIASALMAADSDPSAAGSPEARGGLVHGLDLGGLETGHRRRVFHRDGRVHLDGRPLLDAMCALGDEIATPPPADELLLVGRRQVRTNNSWMHNVPAMVSGRERCLLW